MTTTKQKESVEVKTFKKNEKNAEQFNPLKPQQKDVHVFYVGRIHKKEGTQTQKEELMAAIERIAKEVDKDPNVWKKEEEFYKKYGTLTGEDMRRTFTI